MKKETKALYEKVMALCPFKVGDKVQSIKKWNKKYLPLKGTVMAIRVFDDLTYPPADSPFGIRIREEGDEQRYGRFYGYEWFEKQ